MRLHVSSSSAAAHVSESLRRHTVSLRRTLEEICRPEVRDSAPLVLAFFLLRPAERLLGRFRTPLGPL